MESEHSVSAETELHPLAEATFTSKELLAVGARGTPWASSRDPVGRGPVDALDLGHASCPEMSAESAPAARCSSEVRSIDVGRSSAPHWRQPFSCRGIDAPASRVSAGGDMASGGVVRTRALVLVWSPLAAAPKQAQSRSVESGSTLCGVVPFGDSVRRGNVGR